MTLFSLYDFFAPNQEVWWGWLGAGWLGEAKVSCILRHWGVQLILTYSWANPAILAAGKYRGGNVFISSVSSLSFIFLFLPSPSFSFLLLCLYLSSPFLWEITQNDPKELTCSWTPTQLKSRIAGSYCFWVVCLFACLFIMLILWARCLIKCLS